MHSFSRINYTKSKSDKINFGLCKISNSTMNASFEIKRTWNAKNIIKSSFALSTMFES